MSRKACHKENRARTLLGGLSKCPGKLATKTKSCQDIARRTFKMIRKACHKENRATIFRSRPKACHQQDRDLSGGPSKCPGKLATKRTVPGPCKEDFHNAPESLPQRELRQDCARRTFKMTRKACHIANRARTVLGGPSKCSAKLATKGTVPGPCEEKLQNVPESLPQREPCQDCARRTFETSRKACHR